MIIFPGWVEHGVREVSIKESEYFDGYGRYSITSFFGSKPRSIDRTWQDSENLVDYLCLGWRWYYKTH